MDNRDDKPKEPATNLIAADVFKDKLFERRGIVTLELDPSIQQDLHVIRARKHLRRGEWEDALWCLERCVETWEIVYCRGVARMRVSGGDIPVALREMLMAMSSMLDGFSPGEQTVSRGEQTVDVGMCRSFIEEVEGLHDAGRVVLDEALCSRSSDGLLSQVAESLDAALNSLSAEELLAGGLSLLLMDLKTFCHSQSST